MLVLIIFGQTALRVIFSSGRYLPNERTKPTTALGKSAVRSCFLHRSDLLLRSSVHGEAWNVVEAAYRSYSHDFALTTQINTGAFLQSFRLHVLFPRYPCLFGCCRRNCWIANPAVYRTPLASTSITVRSGFVKPVASGLFGSQERSPMPAMGYT
jgi:hypothetical protein